MNFTKDTYGVVASMVALFLIMTLMLLWNFLGLDSGSGGTPYDLLE